MESKLNLLKITSRNGENILENRKRALKYNEDIANDKEKLWKLKHRNDQYQMKIASGDSNVKKAERGSIGDIKMKCQQLKLPPLVTRSARI